MLFGVHPSPLVHRVTEKVAVLALVAGAGVAAAWSVGLIKGAPAEAASAAEEAASEKENYVKDRV